MSTYHRGVHKFKHLELVPNSVLKGVGAEYPGQNVFYVDKDGSDSNDGRSVQTPFKTIEKAISSCTASKYDAIVVMQESPSSATTGESWPVDIDKQGILLTGLYSRGLISDSGFGPGASDATDCIYIAANHCAVENLYLQVSSGGSAKSIITTDAASVYGFTLRNCWLGLQNTATYGFYTSAAADWPYLLIEDCFFGVPNASNATSWIKLFNASFSCIRRNVFNPASSYIIDAGAQCGNVAILDNRFKMASDTDGYAIKLNTGSSDCFVDGNHATFGSNSMGNHAFFDAGSDANDWGLNYEEIDAVLPDTA
jgi:hypothetical protein